MMAAFTTSFCLWFEILLRLRRKVVGGVGRTNIQVFPHLSCVAMYVLNTKQ